MSASTPLPSSSSPTTRTWPRAVRTGSSGSPTAGSRQRAFRSGLKTEWRPSLLAPKSPQEWGQYPPFWIVSASASVVDGGSRRALDRLAGVIRGLARAAQVTHVPDDHGCPLRRVRTHREPVDRRGRPADD